MFGPGRMPRLRTHTHFIERHPVTREMIGTRYACGTRVFRNGTSEPRDVTCENCRRTRAWSVAYDRIFGDINA